ncbi:MAG: hypothetical protein A3H91_16320 [Gammaproteobacteria bacterium RIFCSPLOWO2_02_FULL_61_13]|nr:MAG: hypothetical protein A3H91_16320 [Gammaproteobacteria bacterium RIFCSPLOWO2_02_FULL_61_13]
MSLRKDDGALVKPTAGAAAWSISNRLAFLYAASTVLLLSIMTGVMFWAVVRFVEYQQAQFLTEEVGELKSLLLEYRQATDFLEREIIAEGAASEKGSYLRSLYTRVVVLPDSLLIETPGMTKVLPSAEFEAHVDPDQSSKKWTAEDGRRFLLMSVTVHSTDQSGESWRIQGALDVTEDHRLIAGYQRLSLLVLLPGVLIAVVLGISVTRRGLQPLQEITEATRHITGSRLSARMGHKHWPRELDALASAFDQMLDRLEESFNRLSQYSADLAHELRTPINNLMVVTEVALSRPRTAEEYRHLLESTMEDYQRLSRMAESLLFLARADSSQSPLKYQRVNAIHELESVREFYEVLADENGVHLNCTGDASLEVDPMLFRRAVGNLVANAIRHTPRGGSIVLSARTQPGGAVQIRVSDTGSGIEAQHLDRIFDRFYRADSSRSQGAEGAGLGLSIIQSIMTLHGGTVAIESAPEEGTIVTLTFPARSGHRVAGATADTNTAN